MNWVFIKNTSSNVLMSKMYSVPSSLRLCLRASTLDDAFQNVYKTKHLEVIVFKHTSLISLLFAVNPDNQQ